MEMACAIRLQIMGMATTVWRNLHVPPNAMRGWRVEGRLIDAGVWDRISTHSSGGRANQSVLSSIVTVERADSVERPGLGMGVERRESWKGRSGRSRTIRYEESIRRFGWRVLIVDDC